MSDVQEAADRIINVFKSRLHYGNLCGSLDADIVKLAELVRSEHDPTPLSPEVLERFGFQSSQHSFKGHGRDMFLSKVYVRFSADKTDTILWVYRFGRTAWADIPKWLAPRNAGELRCLLKRLEVQYEEKEA